MSALLAEGLGVQMAEVDALNQRGDSLRKADPELAGKLYLQAQALAQSGELAGQPYVAGLAASLAGQAAVSIEALQPEQAAQKALQALAYLDENQPTATIADVYLTLSWLNQHIGDYATALVWGHKAQQTSRGLGLAEKEARAWDAVATVQGLLRDFAGAVPTHERALQIAVAIQDRDAEITVTNNYAMTLLDQGDYPRALAIAQRSLELARHDSWPTVLENALDTVGQILVAMGEYAQAQTLFEEALGDAPLASQLYQAYLRKNLGRVYLVQGATERAEVQIEAALGLARQAHLSREQAECHELLATLAETTGDLAGALAHFKQFHNLRESIVGEEAAKQLALTHVIHEVETAKRDAEIQRLRNLELQTEIEERKRFQASLEILVRSDSLTGLYNRGYFFGLAEQEFGRAVQFNRPLAVLMLDLDHFKRVNDTHGHAIGDQVLMGVAGRLRAGLRKVDLLGRIGGEEFAVVLPETSPSEALETAQRLCRALAVALPTTAGLIVVTTSVGVCGLLPQPAPTGFTFDQLLGCADLAMYRAKRAGRNQAQIEYLPGTTTE